MRLNELQKLTWVPSLNSRSENIRREPPALKFFASRTATCGVGGAGQDVGGNKGERLSGSDGRPSCPWLTGAASVKKIYDAGGDLGGSLKRDKLWLEEPLD